MKETFRIPPSDHQYSEHWVTAIMSAAQLFVDKHGYMPDVLYCGSNPLVREGDDVNGFTSLGGFKISIHVDWSLLEYEYCFEERGLGKQAKTGTRAHPDGIKGRWTQSVQFTLRPGDYVGFADWKVAIEDYVRIMVRTGWKPDMLKVPPDAPCDNRRPVQINNPFRFELPTRSGPLDSQYYMESSTRLPERLAWLPQDRREQTRREGDEIPMASGAATSSKIPRLELNPTEAIVRLAARFEEGIRRKPPGKAWNALSANQEVLVDREFILARIGHVEYHCHKLRDKIKGDWPLTDDDAGAIIWGGAFLCCATKALEDAKVAMEPKKESTPDRTVLDEATLSKMALPISAAAKKSFDFCYCGKVLVDGRPCSHKAEE